MATPLRAISSNSALDAFSSSGGSTRSEMMGVSSTSDTVSDVLDTPIISKRVEPPELEKASKAEFELRARRGVAIGIDLEKESNPDYKAKGPVTVDFLHYDVKKDISGNLIYSVIIDSHYKAHDSRHGNYVMHNISSHVTFRTPFVNEQGEIKYSDLDKGRGMDIMSKDKKLKLTIKEAFEYIHEFQQHIEEYLAEERFG